MLNNTIGQLRILGILEGISYLLIFGVTMPLKYGLDMHGPNKVVGMIHGMLFISYCIWVLLAAKKYSWKGKTTAGALVASVLPFGTFVADKKIFRWEE